MLLTPMLLKPTGGAAAEAIEVGCLRLTLSTDDEPERAVDSLRWRGGCALSSGAEGFGGFSDLLLAPDGRGLVTISDKGRWLSAALASDADGNVAGLTARSEAHTSEIQSLMRTSYDY